ncbi:MAG TPA: alpha/beta hydrolase [Allosphingosinicella sp.]|nr:alpha/beta hydrolase [Allosphingosinicella sp.]
MSFFSSLLLGLALAGLPLPQDPAAPAAGASAPERATIPATPARQVTIDVHAPAAPRAVVIFSHGGAGGPDHYPALFARLEAAGFAVLAPLHVDSRAHPDTARYTIQSAFPERIADLAAAAGYARTRWPGLKLVAMGHSYGSLFAQMQGGALDQIAPVRVPGLAAVVSFSSPGIIPGLIQPTAFAHLDVPTLLVTGTRDLVPGFVTDWRDHLASQRGAPAGDHYALVLPEADHFLALARDSARFEAAMTAMLFYLDGYVFGDAAARAALLRQPGLERR